MKKRIHVKPVTDKTDLFGWIAIEQTDVQSFFDDRKRYGFWIAIRNLFILLRR